MRKWRKELDRESIMRKWSEKEERKCNEKIEKESEIRK